MPPWFDHWYQQQLRVVHQKLNDPEESGFWLDNQLKEAGPPPSDPTSWQQQMEQAIISLPDTHSEESLPEGWETITSSDQNSIKEIFAGRSPFLQVSAGEALETLLSPCLSGQSLKGEKALWIWQYLLGRIGMAEENLMRHWVDAEEENLQAFEERYELYDQLCRIPGTISIDTDSIWQACFPNSISQVSKKTASRRTKSLMIGTMIVSMIAALSAVLWVTDPTSESVRLSESLTAQMLDGDSPIELERNQLTFIGEVKLRVAVKDSIRMLGGLVIFDPGIYVVRLDGDEAGHFVVFDGHLKAFLDEEVFVLEKGMSLEKKSGYWLKEWD